MARVETVTLVDDVDGSEAAETVEFTIDRKAYEIDLSEANADRLREVLAEFVEKARRVGGRSNRPASAAATRATVSDREQTRAMRDWANSNGFTVSDRGRLPVNVIEAFNNRGSGGTVSPIRPVAPVVEAPAPQLDDKGKAAAVAAAKAPRKGKPATALKAAADNAEATAATKAAAKAGKLPGVKVLTLTGAQAKAIEDFRLPTFEVGATFAVFKGATPAEVLAEIQAAIKVYSGDKTGGSYRALTSVVRKLQKADPKMVSVVEVDASAA